jgi:hypothetical protein
MSLQTNRTDNVDVIHAVDVNQYHDLLTGVMTDQPVTLKDGLAISGGTGATLTAAGALAVGNLTVSTGSGPYSPTAPPGGGRFGGTVPAGSTTPLVQEGSAPFDGTSAGFFTGSGNGTIQGINAASGFTGSLADWQTAGVSQFKVSGTGLGTLNGALVASTSMVTDPRLGSVAASLEAAGSLLTAGSIVLTTNNAYLAFYSSNFAMNVQAGGPRNVALAATSTLTLPDLALGTSTPASGYLCAVPTGQVVGHGIKSADGYGAMADCGYPMSDPNVNSLTVGVGNLAVNAGGVFVPAGTAGVNVINLSNLTSARLVGSATNFGINNNANNATNLLIADTGLVTVGRSSLAVAGDNGSGTASQLMLTNATGIGNGANTNMQSPIVGTGSGPTSAVLVTKWLKIYDGATTKWIPAFT